MSWEAVRWAMAQDPGDPILKWVLIGTCNFVNKRSGKTYVTPKTVAEFCNIKRSQSVADWQKKLGGMRLLRDTGERGGGNGRVIFWAPGWDKKLTTPRVASSQQTNNELTTDLQQTNNTLITPSVTSFIGKVGTNLEALTLNPVDKRVSSKNSHLLSNKEETKPRPSWPSDVVEVFEYIFDHKNDDNCDLRQLRKQIEDGDIEWWFNANQAKGWKGIEDWRAWLEATFAAGHFPSQKRKMKGKR